MDSLDQPIGDITVGVGWRKTSSTVAAVCLASCAGHPASWRP
jgi:hypothetical protein